MDDHKFTVAPSDLKDQQSIWKVAAWLVEQLGGSVALDRFDAMEIMENNKRSLTIYSDDRGNTILKVESK